MENEETEATTEKAVDPGKYQTVLRGRREALSRVAELEDQLRELQARAGLAEQLQAQLADAQSAAGKIRDEYESERGLWRAGLTDPEGIEIARLLYGRLPAEGRPADPHLPLDRGTGFSSLGGQRRQLGHDQPHPVDQAQRQRAEIGLQHAAIGTHHY